MAAPAPFDGGRQHSGFVGKRFAASAGELILIALLALGAVGYGVWGVGIGSGEIDPFHRFGAMDEVVYGHAAARMVQTGHWATAVYLDRFLLNKPPLLMWSGALAMRVFGVSTAVLRLPVVLAGTFCCMAIYWWTRRLRQPVPVAVIAMVLLAANPVFHTMSRKFMTDILLTLWITLAAFLLSSDSALKNRRTAWLYGILAGAAIMTKSAAGSIPLMVLAFYWILGGRANRPPLRRVLIAWGTAFLVAAPWHVYQIAAHRDWFITEYVKVQLVGMGMTEPAVTGSDPNLWFYLRGIFLTDPVLALLSLAAIPGLVAAWKREDRVTARILAIWIAVTLACLAAFANRASYYCLSLMPALALLSARFAPMVRRRFAAWPACAILVALFFVKATAPGRMSGLDFRQGTTIASAGALDAYARLKRDNELVSFLPDDQLYSSVIDLPKVRYAWITPAIDYSKAGAFFYWLGIIVTPDEFCRPAHTAVFTEHLKAWRAPGNASLSTVVMATTNEALEAVIRCSPDRDFFLPDEMRNLAVAGVPAHRIARLGPGRFFLLAANSAPRRAGQKRPGTLVAAH